MKQDVLHLHPAVRNVVYVIVTSAKFSYNLLTFLISILFGIVYVLSSWLVFLLYHALTWVAIFVGNLFLLIWSACLTIFLGFIHISWLVLRAYVKLMSFNNKMLFLNQDVNSRKLKLITLPML